MSTNAAASPQDPAAEETVIAAVGEGLLRELTGSSCAGGDVLFRAAMAHARAVFEDMGFEATPRAYAADSGLQASVYRAVRSVMGSPAEQLLWHGTSWQSVASILRNGFNRAYAGRHGTRLGAGTYFSTDAGYALRFCSRGRPRALLLARVLVGKYAKGDPGLVEPPLLDDSTATGAKRYDSTVDNCEDPRVFCVFKDFQALPVGLVVVT